MVRTPALLIQAGRGSYHRLSTQPYPLLNLETRVDARQKHEHQLGLASHAIPIPLFMSLTVNEPGCHTGGAGDESLARPGPQHSRTTPPLAGSKQR